MASYRILNSVYNRNRRNSSAPPKGWTKSKQAYWSDKGKQAKNISYKKGRNTRRTDNPLMDGMNKSKKYRFKMKVKSKNGILYTRYVYRKPVKSSTIKKYMNK